MQLNGYKNVTATSIIELNKSALHTNIKFLKKRFGKNVKFSSVVKGNAYGHGIEKFVPMAENCGIDHFSVFSSDEAYRVCDVKKPETKVMIMGMVDDDELEWIIKKGVEFYVFEIERLEAAVLTANKLGIKAKIHIEIETGMNRTGFPVEVWSKVVEIVKNNSEYLIVEGFCTHYAGAESIANFHRVQNQIKRFNKAYKWFVDHGVKPMLRHTACSAAAMNHPKTRMDMVRIGILQYGFWPSEETLIHYVSNKEDKRDPLVRVISWKSKIMSIKKAKMGEFVGYGTVYLANKDMKIATVPVGYSHGFSRSLSNQGRVLIHGQRVTVIGMVNMNMMTLDVSDLPEVQRGDEVVMIGQQGDLTISVSHFGRMSDQLNYELLTRLPRNIPRIVIDQNV